MTKFKVLFITFIQIILLFGSGHKECHHCSGAIWCERPDHKVSQLCEGRAQRSSDVCRYSAGIHDYENANWTTV